MLKALVVLPKNGRIIRVLSKKREYRVLAKHGKIGIPNKGKIGIPISLRRFKENTRGKTVPILLKGLSLLRPVLRISYPFG